MNAIWGEFTGRLVRRASDNVPMTYYGQWACANIDSGSLIAAGDGQCGAWVSLFLDTLRIHDIDYPNEYRLLGWQSNTNGFLVANWTLIQPGHSGVAGYPYLNLPDWAQWGNPYTWDYSEANDQVGVAGQSNADPASLFNNHQVAEINGVYYDPAYGTLHVDIPAFRSALSAFFAYGQLMVDENILAQDVNGNGTATDVFLRDAYVSTGDTQGHQLPITSGDYPFP